MHSWTWHLLTDLRVKVCTNVNLCTMVQHAPGYCSCQLLSFSQVSTCQLQSTINWSALSDSIVRPCNLCSATVCLTWLQHAISTEGIEMTYSTLPKVPGRGIFIWYDCCFSQLFLLLVPAPCFTQRAMSQKVALTCKQDVNFTHGVNTHQEVQ